MPTTKRKERHQRVVAPQAEPSTASAFRFEATDAMLLVLLLGFAMLLLARTGFANGQELWPMPDAVEYAAMAANMDRGLGPVLHFAGITYPARYTIGYPLMLAAAYPILGHQPERLCLVTALMALVAIAGLYLLTLWSFDRASAVAAAMLLATSPHFLGLSTCVVSDVPALSVIILAVLAFLYAEEKESIAAAALCGLLVGWAITIRITDGAIFVGMVAALLLVQPRRLQRERMMAFALGFIPFPGLQAWVNHQYVGSLLSSGYAFWRPDLYSFGLGAFDWHYLFESTFENISHGNLVAYGLAMLGLDGLLGQLNVGMESRNLLHSRYSLYPFPVVIFAALGVMFVLRGKRDSITMRTLYLGGAFLATLLMTYLVYFYLEPRFLLPGLFIVFATGGYGLVCANRSMRAGGWARVAVVVLDVVLAAAMVVETVSRLAMPSPDSKLVAEMHALRPRLANAVLVSDVSLLWLNLFAGDEHIEFVGLDSLLADEALNEYHLHYLYEKNTQGQHWPMPPILLPEGKIDPVEAGKLAAEDKDGRPLYLLVVMPMRRDWASTLMGEFGELDRNFSLQTVARYPNIGLYRLRPR